MRPEKKLDLPSEDTEINGTVYRVSKLPMGDWIALESTISKVVGPAIGELLAGPGGVKALMDRDVSAEALGAAIYRITSQADETVQRKILGLLEKATKIVDADGKDHFLAADHWPRHMRDLGPWLIFALGVSLGDFIAGFVGAIPAGASPEAEKSQND